MNCFRCQQDSPIADAQFCPRCGAPANHPEDSAAPLVAYADLQRELTEAREQQTATSEILSVIRSSPSDLQPVFDTIVRLAGVVCGGVDAILWTIDGAELVVRAHHGPLPATIGARQPIHGSVAGYAVREARVVHVEDLTEADDFPVGRDLARRLGWRTTLSAPLLREGVAIGAILIRRSEVRPFTDKQIALLQTFADQAVIAIENVRLLTELQEKNSALTVAHGQVTESLEQQMATGEILRVIAASPTDAQPVFEAVARNAMRLCESTIGVVSRYDGELLHLVAHSHHDSPEAVEMVKQIFPARPSRAMLHGRVVLEGAVVHLPDVFADAEFRHSIAIAFRARSALGVPMLLDGRVIGVIALARDELRPFTESHIALLQTFADQAVIAIENVRLFTETNEALERQTATSEILGVISSSPKDAQPVLDTIVKSAARLCDGVFATLFRFDGELLHWVAQHNNTAAGLEAMRQRFPRPPGPDTVVGRAILDRTVIHVPDSERGPDVPVESREIARAFGYRSVISVPMLHDGQPVGGLSVARRNQPFSPAQIALLQTFADQAVIAIENVRLFKELEARNKDLTESLEQQTATSEILRVISSSPTDLTPVFETILANASKLSGANLAALWRFDGEQMIGASHYNASPEFAHRIMREPLKPGRQGPSRQAALERRVVHVADMTIEPGYSPVLLQFERARTVLAVPLLREDTLVGVMAMWRREVQPFTEQQIALVQTFADQAVIAIENVRLFTELQASNRELTTALDTQTATSDILRVISRSQTDVQPVFDAILASAVRLLGAYAGALSRIVGDQIELAALMGHNDAGDAAVRSNFPYSLESEGSHARAIRDRAPLNIADVPAQAAAGVRDRTAWPSDIRSLVVVPMLLHDEAVGAIGVTRREPGGFTDDEIALLQTFADQAVIAIENVRLFTELQASNRELTTALDTQTATSDILGVISRSQADVQPVFEAIAENAARLVQAWSVTVLRWDGESIHLAAERGGPPGSGQRLRDESPWLPNTTSGPGRCIATGTVIHVPDVDLEPEDDTATRELAHGRGWRSNLCVPMLRDGSPIGAISVTRVKAGPFSPGAIELLETFADQAVIAIENVRLFKELEARNSALRESLEQQTATSEILRVISSSPTDVQPVFNTIVRNAVGLCDGLFGALYRFDGELLHLVAHYNYTPEALEAAHRVFPGRPSRGGGPGRAILDRVVALIPDVQLDLEHRYPAVARAVGWRSGLFVPMLREGAPIGVIAVTRAEPRPFSNSEIELLKTFADQAVIAIENVRLFTELQARTAELTRSVDELTALGDVGRVLSSTLDLETVLQTIVTRANQLADADGGSVYEYDEQGEAFHLRATDTLDDEVVAMARRTPVPRSEGVLGRMAVTREPVQIPDIAQEGAYRSPLRDVLLRTGRRALLAVPLLREDHLIGGLTVNKKTPGEFSPEVIDLLRTFASQSALAIQNARLFREIEDKSRQLEVASRHKSEFLANMSHELRTPLNAIIGFSEVLGERMFGELNEKQEEYLKDIYASGQHLLSLINDILDLSKIEAGRMELELTDFYLPAALDNAMTLVRERAGRRGIALHAEVDERLGQIQADERKIRQVVLNLLSNAIKFTPEGGRIEVGAVPKDGSVEVSVSDTGVGIAPEDQEAIFEEFRQVGTAAKKVEGTGLGLALSRKFIELHGGRIWVESEVGAGSTFTFTIPMRP